MHLPRLSESCLLGTIFLLSIALPSQVPTHGRLFSHGPETVGGASYFVGNSVVGLTDFLGASSSPDGHQDYAIGAPIGSRILIVSGRTGVAEFTVTGFTSGDGFGKVMIPMHDFDNDGTDDILVSAPWWGRSSTVPNVGRVAVISAAKGTLIAYAEGSGANEYFGSSLARIGDIDNDSFPDYAIAATGYPTGSGWGQVVILSGKDMSTVLKTYTGTGNGDSFGLSIAGPGDLDNDGVPDIVVSSSTYTKAHSNKFGLLLKNLTSVRGPLQTIGDLNGDTKPDILLCDDRNLWAYSLPGFTPIFSIRNVNGYPTAPGDIAVTDLGDVNGDGVSDIAVGEPNATASNYTRNGLVSIYSGKTQVKLDTLTGVVNVQHGGMGYGVALSSADVDGDGIRDVIAGHRGQQILGQPHGQFAYVTTLKPLLLTTDGHTISLLTGGTVNYNLDAGPARAGQYYYFAGSVSGYRPGFTAWGQHFPLNIDVYFNIIVNSPNGPLFSSSFGILDANGRGTATLKSIPNAPANLLGITLDHAAAILCRTSSCFIETVTRNRPVTVIQ
ncbi:MAG: FG-GAP repeat protein [Planctomycetes bacterium]|nr:FG-GAP repeat protein [Planctomycetota bacterium]